MYSNLTINVGGMFSGKTTELLRQGKRHTLAKDSVVYIKPNIDDRYSNTKIVTHTGDYTSAMVVGIDECITRYEDVTNADVVLIDEVQFFNKGIVLDILMLLSWGKKVYCSGLDLSYNNKPFEVTMLLMAYSDNVQKFKAVCGNCGMDAWITARKGSSEGTDSVVDVGSAEKYMPLCRECYSKNSIGGLI